MKNTPNEADRARSHPQGSSNAVAVSDFLALLKEQPRKTTDPHLFAPYAEFVFLLEFQGLASKAVCVQELHKPSPDFKSNSEAVDRMAASISKMISTRSGLEEALLTAKGSLPEFVDALIFVHCRVKPDLSHPFVRLRIDEAASRNDTKFFRRLADALKSGPVHSLSNLEKLLIYGWEFPVAQNVPPLNRCTDRAIQMFAKKWLSFPSLTEAAVKKARQRLKLRRLKGLKFFRSAKKRLSEWRFE